jgi:hypothetical protein
MPSERRPPAGAVRQASLPKQTPITKLGLLPADAKGLTPAARKLTRGDLIAMMEGRAPKAAQALTVRDLTSISNVYARSLSAIARPAPGCCSCSCGLGGCCCCCCAAAAEPPV